MPVKGKSTQEIKVENYQSFMDWKDRMSNEDYIQIVSHKGSLTREEIATQCGFSRSSFHTNDDIKRELAELEDELRKRGILPILTKKAKVNAAKPKLHDQNATQGILDARRASELEQENLQLKARISVLEGKLDNLGRFQELSEVMVEMLEDDMDE